MKKLLKKFMKDERGLELSEYAVLLALIVVALFVAVIALRDAVSAKFNQTATAINSGTT